MAANSYKVYIIMGVSGCGKSTIGKLLAEDLMIPFFDGDDYHPATNIQKMSEGIPLNDNDRREWLIALNLLAKEHLEDGCVIACSALKEKYRQTLRKDIANSICIIYLEGSMEEIMERHTRRKDHFMPSSLLKSQFDVLEVPKDAITVPIALSPVELLEKIKTLLPKM